MSLTAERAPASTARADLRDRFGDAAAEAGSAARAAPPSDRKPRPARRKGRGFSRLTQRILMVNMIALAILVGGLLYLVRYQDRLLQQELDALSAQARLYAWALAEGAVDRTESNIPFVAPDLAEAMVSSLVQTPQTRVRLFDRTGTLMVDSHRIAGHVGIIEVEKLPPKGGIGNPIDVALDALQSGLNGLSRPRTLPLFPEQEQLEGFRNPVIQPAMEGETFRAVWSDGKNGLVLSISSPIQRFKEVLGVVTLTTSGTRIDQAVAEVRRDILNVFFVALGVTILMSFYLASTITNPIRRLAEGADRVRTGMNRKENLPDFSTRQDEIGDLSASLQDMTHSLWQRMDAIERFAADVSHEIKNPLTSLRSAVETLGRVKDENAKAKLLAIIQDDVGRLDRLITDISDASRVDAEMSRALEERVDLATVVRMLAETHNGSLDEGDASAVRVVPAIDESGGRLSVRGKEGRIVQVLENLIGNAMSFSPKDGVVRLLAERRAEAGRNHIVLRVEDEGPGIPDGKAEKIFERFYSERPAGEKFGTHSGLGLSICRQIVEGHGGTIRAENRMGADGRVEGARFIVSLPAA
jgi:two-component system sensor histidine kinase ChvG